MNQLDKAYALLEQGFSREEILSFTTIPIVSVHKTKRISNGRIHWTEEEKRLAKSMDAEGISWKKIGSALGRKEHAIEMFFYRQANPEKFNKKERKEREGTKQSLILDMLAKNNGNYIGANEINEKLHGNIFSTSSCLSQLFVDGKIKRMKFGKLGKSNRTIYKYILTKEGF